MLALLNPGSSSKWQEGGLTNVFYIVTKMCKYKEMNVTATPHQLHAALSYCNDFAVEMLTKAGEFHPFGGFVQPDGQVVAVGGYIGEEYPDAQELFKFLTDSMDSRLSNGEAIATALTVNVNIPPEYAATYRDGIRVTLKSNDYHRLIYIPYKIRKTGLFKSRVKVQLADSFSVE